MATMEELQRQNADRKRKIMPLGGFWGPPDKEPEPVKQSAGGDYRLTESEMAMGEALNKETAWFKEFYRDKAERANKISKLAADGMQITNDEQKAMLDLWKLNEVISSAGPQSQHAPQLIDKIKKLRESIQPKKAVTEYKGY